MTEPEYVSPPPKTLEDIEELVRFIKGRVKPVRDKASLGSEERRTAESLLDVTVSMHGAAQGESEDNSSFGYGIGMIYIYLAAAARQWPGHPDFNPAWE